MTDTQKPEGSIVRKAFQSYAQIKKEYSEDQLNFIIKTVAPTLNKDEVIIFIMRCEKLGIDPMSGDISAYVSISQKTKERKLTMIVGRNWKRERGMANPHVKSVVVEAIYTKAIEKVVRTYNASEVKVGEVENGKKVGELVEVKEKEISQVPEWGGGVLWGAICTIVRDDYEKPFVITAPLSEYKGWNVWEKKPSTMIKKVAESQCWDLAVPELSKVYDESERFDDEPTAKKAPTMEGGSNPATEEQLATIANLKGEAWENITKQEAADLIKELASKGKK